MKWTRVVAGLIVALGATACLAETPDLASSRPSAISLLQRGPLFGGQNWWNRFGEPVNATALANAETSVSDRTAGPMPIYGDGYIYGPGSCDCSPPCIWQLWNGYYQYPKRCHPGGWLNGCGGNGCGGNGCCGNGWGCGNSLFGCGKGCGGSCATAAPACAAPVGCTTTASCGCKPVCGKCRQCHLSGLFHGWTAHWHKPCRSCTTPLGCGCTAPAAPIIEPGPSQQAATQLPVPLPEDAALFQLPRLN
jgi:hypothetical protein